MDKITLITVTASNIFGLVPIYSLFSKKRYHGTLLVSSACLASVFMHATETKHNLSGLFLNEYSNIFLKIDRFIAYLTGVYGLYLFYMNPVKTLPQVALPIVGGLASMVGEFTEYLPLYTFLHCVWHGLAYYSLHLVNH